MARIFGQTENTNPNDNMKIAFGRAGVATENMTLASFVTWLNSKLSFLKVANNLSDLANKPTACANLGVYTKLEIDAKLKVVPYTACTLVSAKVNASGFTIKAAQFGSVVTLTGDIELTANAEGEILFTLPSTIDECNTQIDLSAINSDTSRIEMFIDAGSRNVYSYRQYSDGANMKFCTSYVAI